MDTQIWIIKLFLSWLDDVISLSRPTSIKNHANHGTESSLPKYGKVYQPYGRFWSTTSKVTIEGALINDPPKWKYEAHFLSIAHLCLEVKFVKKVSVWAKFTVRRSEISRPRVWIRSVLSRWWIRRYVRTVTKSSELTFYGIRKWHEKWYKKCLLCSIRT